MFCLLNFRKFVFLGQHLSQNGDFYPKRLFSWGFELIFAGVCRRRDMQSLAHTPTSAHTLIRVLAPPPFLFRKSIILVDFQIGNEHARRGVAARSCGRDPALCTDRILRGRDFISSTQRIYHEQSMIMNDI